MDRITTATDFADYLVKEKKLKSFMYCNGARLTGQFMKDVIDSGIDFIRISIIGYNKSKYKQWMDIDNFDLILSNIKEIKEYIKKTNKQL